MGFLLEFDHTPPNDQTKLIIKWVAQRPRELFEELRGHRPILVFPAGAIITRFRDVVEVLSRHEVFSVRRYQPKMADVTGPFFLGEDDNQTYRDNRAVANLALRPEDVPRLKTFAATTTEQLIQEYARDGRLEIVQSVARRVPARLVAEYYGIPGPDEDTLLKWARPIFAHIFENLLEIESVTQTALAAAAELRAYLATLIGQRNRELANTTPDRMPNDLLGRFIVMQRAFPFVLDPQSIRHNLIGIMVGTFETMSKAVAHSMDVLLRLPEQLKAAREAAIKDDDERLSAYVFEALRFQPTGMTVIRQAEQNYRLCQGTMWETKISKGSLVFPVTASAMFDESVIPEPNSFRIDRPDRHYFHFGYGLHSCYGKSIAQAVLPQVCKHLLKLPNLRRETGPEGKLRFTKTSPHYPDSMVLRFG